MNCPAFAPGRDQARVFERAEVLRDGRLRDVEAGREVFDRRFAPRQRLEDRSAARVGQGLEDLVFGHGDAHDQYISSDLWIVKLERRRQPTIWMLVHHHAVAQSGPMVAPIRLSGGHTSTRDSEMPVNPLGATPMTS